jgi:hypothetical protein
MLELRRFLGSFCSRNSNESDEYIHVPVDAADQAADACAVFDVVVIAEGAESREADPGGKRVLSVHGHLRWMPWGIPDKRDLIDG